MSLLAELYLAKDEDAVRYNTTPGAFADRAEHTSFTTLEISTLWAIMRGIEWDVDLLDEFPCLLEVDGGERLIHRVPAEMVAELTVMSTEEIGRVTAEWAATEELDCRPEDVRPIVDNMIRLSRLAMESGRSL